MDFSNPVRAIVPSLEGEIFRVLARTTTPLSGSRIALLAEAGSNPGIRLALGRLVRQGTVMVMPSVPSLLYSANRLHLLWPAIEEAVRSAHQALLTLESRISELADAHADGAPHSAVTLALFGSVARGSSAAQSDIDIVAVFPATELTTSEEALVDAMTSEVPRWTGNACNVYATSWSEIHELFERNDPIVVSWREDAATFYGRDLREFLQTEIHSGR